MIIPKFSVVYEDINNYKLVPNEISLAIKKLAAFSCGMGQLYPIYKENQINVIVNYSKKKTKYCVGRTLSQITQGGQSIIDLYMINMETNKKRELFILQSKNYIIHNLEL